MGKIHKKIKVTGKCKTCKKKAEAEVVAIGERGQSGDWKGYATCCDCGNKVSLEKKNVKF